VVDDPRKLKPGRFWPDQMFMDGFASLVVFLFIIALAFIAPPFLDAKADPTNGSFVPYPAWYFLFLFGLLNLVPIFLGNGPFPELLAAIIVPTIGILIVFALPWIDRSTTRSFKSRAGILWTTLIVCVVIVALSVYAQGTIQANIAKSGVPQQTEDQILSAPAEAATAPVSGAAANGSKVFSTNCSSCHGASGQGQAAVAPPLAGNPFVTGDPNAVITVVENGLHGQTVMGQTFGAPMPSWKGTLSKSDIADVITYIRSGIGSNKASAVTVSQIK
jgi:mono/diheme cytochrome c family protein